MARPTYSTEGGRSRNVQLIDFNNGSQADAFGRLRISNPYTLFDSKATTDASGIFYDDAEVSGGGTTSVYSENRASFTIGVSAETAGRRVRQTKQRFNYQPGKSQLIMLTGVFGAPAAGITKRIGYFDADNGLGLKIDSSGASFFIRSNRSGTPVDTEIESSVWALDDMWPETSLNGLDYDKAQIFFIDFEWLGVGSVRFGFIVDGLMITCHQANHANIETGVYMSKPNLPVRYEIENDGTGAADDMEIICASIISEGGQEETGITRYISTGSTQVDANVAGTVYAVTGIRLKAGYLDTVVKVISTSCICTANPNFEWLLVLNPTVASTFTYNALANSSIEYATGATANTVTGGTVLSGGYSTSETVGQGLEKSLYYLGAKIDGTRDEIVLCVRPLAANADVYGGILVREFS